MDDLDVDIRFGPYLPQIGGGWHVSVSSPVGEATNFMRFTPRMHQILTQRIGSFTGVIANLRAQQNFRAVPSQSEQFAQSVGMHLFNALIDGDIRYRYYASKQDAEKQERGLRLVLHTAGDPALMALPWELLYDPREKEHLCLHNISFIRYMDLERRVPPLEVHGPLRILVAGANPDGVARLNIARERALIQKALSPLEAQGLVKLHWLGAQTTLRQLANAVERDGPWHIVHFICHGGFDAIRSEGFVTLVDENDGGKHQVLATQLGRLFRDRPPRLVVLNSCEGGQGSIKDPFSNIASILTNCGIPAIVAMQYGITDDAAVEFADRFYHELAKGTPVDTAVTAARRALSLHHTNAPEWGTPVLYLRSRSSVLFTRTTASPHSPDLGEEQQTPHPPHPKPRKSPDPLWLRLVAAGLIVLLLSAAVVGGVYWFLLRRPALTTFCIGTDLPTTPGAADTEIPLKKGADLALQLNANLGAGYTIRACDKNDDNGKGVHDTTIGLQNLKGLIADPSVLGMVGPGDSDIARLDIPVALQADLAMIGVNTTDPCLTLPELKDCKGHPEPVPSSYMRICANDLQQGNADADFLFKSLGLHTAFVVNNGQVYGQGLANYFTDRFHTNGGKVLGQDQISNNNTSAQFTQIARKIVSHHPAAVFYGGVAGSGIAYLKMQLALLGFKGPLISGDGVALDDQYLSDAGVAADNTYATSLEPDVATLPPDFIKNYQKYYREKPGQNSAGGYDAAMILVLAIKSVIATDPQVMHEDIKAIREAVLAQVRSTAAYSGLTGTITFDNGDNAAAKVFTVYVVKNGQWTYQSMYTVQD